MPEQADRPLILDFGMHQGEDTDFYLATGADVVAFEANAILVERNRQRFKEQIDSNRLEIVAGAIVAPDFQGAEVVFYHDEQKSVWGTTSLAWAERNKTLGSGIHAVRAPVVDLKTILKTRGQVFYAKVDIEGADRFVLDNIRQSSAKPNFISIESDKLSLQSVIDEIETLQDLGYSRFAAVQQATIPGSVVRGTRFDGTPFTYRFKKHASGPFGPYLKQDYKTAGEVVDQYTSIFAAYRRFGDRSWAMRLAPTRVVTRAINAALVRTLRKPLCGWYDTHAAL
jgi:FkbM family methyltransferase